MRYRAIVIPVVGVIAVLTGFLLFGNLNQNLVYYLQFEVIEPNWLEFMKWPGRGGSWIMD